MINVMNEINRILAMQLAERHAEKRPQEAFDATAKDAARPSESFPPAGWVGSCTWGVREYWFECVLLPGKAIAVNKYGQWMVLEPGRVENVQFQELPSEEDLEREEIICAAAMVMEEDAVITEYDAAVALYDKGLLREPTPDPSPRGEREPTLEPMTDSPKAREVWHQPGKRTDLPFTVGNSK